MLSTLKNSVSWILTPFRRQTTLKSRPLLNQPKQCRICLGDEIEENKDDKLIHPCHCTGHMHYVHRNCLNTWRNYQKQQHLDDSKCDICQYTFNIKNSLPLWLRILRDERFIAIPLAVISVISVPFIRRYYFHKGYCPPENVYYDIGCQFTSVGFFSSFYYMGQVSLNPFFRSSLRTHVAWACFLLLTGQPHNTVTFVLTSSFGALLQCLLEKSMFRDWKQFIDDKTKNYVHDEEIIEDIE